MRYDTKNNESNDKIWTVQNIETKQFHHNNIELWLNIEFDIQRAKYANLVRISIGCSQLLGWKFEIPEPFCFATFNENSIHGFK